MLPKYKRSRIPPKVIGYDLESNKPIYEHRTVCLYCQKQFKHPANRANHELHHCTSNPQVIPPIKHLRKISNQQILTQTRTYHLIQKTVQQILNKLSLNLHYEIYDKETDQIFPLRQAIKWLKTRQVNTIVYLLEYTNERIELS